MKETRPVLFETKEPQEVIQQATVIADVLHDVIEKQGLYVKTGRGNKYVLVEGWTTLANMFNLRPIIISVRKHKEKDVIIYDAACDVYTPDERKLSHAEATCRSDEVLKTKSGKIYHRWHDEEGKPQEFAIKSMAQTRAVGKALRLPLGWIMTLAGYNATPAEEMPASQKSTMEVEFRKEKNEEEAFLEKSQKKGQEYYSSWTAREIVDMLAANREKTGDSVSTVGLREDVIGMRKADLITDEQFQAAMRLLKQNKREVKA